jgi:hypothetical protein
MRMSLPLVGQRDYHVSDSRQGEPRAMDIYFSCPGCCQHMVIDEAGAGLVIPCPKCAGDVAVPEATESTPGTGPHSATARQPDKESTVALKWTPPSATKHEAPKT